MFRFFSYYQTSLKLKTVRFSDSAWNRILFLRKIQRSQTFANCVNLGLNGSATQHETTVTGYILRASEFFCHRSSLNRRLTVPATWTHPTHDHFGCMPISSTSSIPFRTFLSMAAGMITFTALLFVLICAVIDSKNHWFSIENSFPIALMAFLKSPIAFSAF